MQVGIEKYRPVFCNTYQKNNMVKNPIDILQKERYYQNTRLRHMRESVLKILGKIFPLISKNENRTLTIE